MTATLRNAWRAGSPSHPTFEAPRETRAQKHRQDERVDQWFGDVFFHLPPEMPDTENPSRVRAIVNLLPALAKPSPCAGGGSDGHRQENQDRCEAHGDVGALDDIFEDRPKCETLVEHKVYGEMESDIERSKQTYHAPEPGDPHKSGQFSQRCDCKTEQ